MVQNRAWSKDRPLPMFSGIAGPVPAGDVVSEERYRMRRINEWSIARKLGAGFGAVCALFLVALGVALLKADEAQSTWKSTTRWDAAVAGANLQIEGIRQQM